MDGKHISKAGERSSSSNKKNKTDIFLFDVKLPKNIEIKTKDVKINLDTKLRNSSFLDGKNILTDNIKIKELNILFKKIK